ncbi:hypothetical protein Q8A73_003521 [Channa argus]|nr:hypothetical protein Q8A73_003521 [Channa argus]
MVERFNRTLIDQLAKSLLQQPGEWDDCLNQVALAYNTSPHSITGSGQVSPFFLIRGREARMPASLLLPNNTPSGCTSGSPADYVGQLTKKLQSAFESAAWNSDCAHDHQKHQYDKYVKHTPYTSGDLVWLSDPTASKQKLAPHWKGPYEILECLGSDMDSPGVTYRIRYLLHQSDKSMIVHYNRLRPYNAPAPSTGQNTPHGYSPVQHQLPSLTALSGALPFGASKPSASKTCILPGPSSTMVMAPQRCVPKPQPHSPSHSPPPPPPQTSPLGRAGVGLSFPVPSTTPVPGRGCSARVSRRRVQPLRYLMDFVTK